MWNNVDRDLLGIIMVQYKAMQMQEMFVDD